MTVNLGDGSDTLQLLYCNVSTLSLDGGSGADAYTTVSSRVLRKTVTSVP